MSTALNQAHDTYDDALFVLCDDKLECTFSFLFGAMCITDPADICAGGSLDGHFCDRKAAFAACEAGGGMCHSRANICSGGSADGSPCNSEAEWTACNAGGGICFTPNCVCGNKVVEAVCCEQYDGNTVNGDGCSFNCQKE